MMEKEGRGPVLTLLASPLFSTNSENLIYEAIVQNNGFCSKFPQNPHLSNHSFPVAMNASLWLPIGREELGLRGKRKYWGAHRLIF